MVMLLKQSCPLEMHIEIFTDGWYDIRDLFLNNPVGGESIDETRVAMN